VNREWGYVDRKGHIVVSPSFDGVGSFGNGLAPVEKNDVWGYISVDGSCVIAAKFSYAGDFHGGLALVRNEAGRYAYINTQGAYVWVDS
jgi:hypothetical protein